LKFADCKGNHYLLKCQMISRGKTGPSFEFWYLLAIVDNKNVSLFAFVPDKH